MAFELKLSLWLYLTSQIGSLDFNPRVPWSSVSMQYRTALWRLYLYQPQHRIPWGVYRKLPEREEHYCEWEARNVEG